MQLIEEIRTAHGRQIPPLLGDTFGNPEIERNYNRPKFTFERTLRPDCQGRKRGEIRSAGARTQRIAGRPTLSAAGNTPLILKCRASITRAFSAQTSSRTSGSSAKSRTGSRAGCGYCRNTAGDILSHVERGCGFNGRDDRLGISLRRVELRDLRLGLFSLLFRCVKDDRAILFAGVVALAVQGRGSCTVKNTSIRSLKVSCAGS